MPGGDLLERAPQRARSVPRTHARPSHRAAPRRRHRTVAFAAAAAVVTGAAVTTLLLSGAGTDAGAAPDQAVAELDPSPVSQETRTVTCWDGTSASQVKQCGVPSGRDGLATVFPSLDAGCAATAPLVGGKAEVFTCRGSGYVIRYTRWQPGFDRFAAFSADNRGLGSEWVVGRQFAGRVWASREQTSDGVRHFKWTATYRAMPFSVEVQATSKAGRSAGMASVGTALPRHLGLG